MLGFAMGPYGCMERTWKPFNPILGETFELDMDKGVRFFAEQVRNDTHNCTDVCNEPITKAVVQSEPSMLGLNSVSMPIAGVAPPTCWRRARRERQVDV